ncbi:MAG TPA: phospholipase D-like domain-containing protein [Gemmatimonadaceae bacterium]
MIALAFIGLLVGVILLMFAFIGILYSLRGTPMKSVAAVGDRSGPPSVSDPLFLRTVELFTGTMLVSGHRVELLANGEELYPRLWDDLQSATRSITLQMYYCRPGVMADTLAAILSERARAGVRVLFLHDAFGSIDLTKEYLDGLREAGVTIAVFRPVHWYSLHKAQSRSHIRVVVVDGRVGYTGGFGLDDKWFGDGRHADQWRDTNVRFTGPAVLELQATFAAGWVEATGTLIVGEEFFPLQNDDATGAQVAGLLHAAPSIGSTSASRFLALSITGARERLYITNSYFVPDRAFRALLIAAVRRGVDVRVLTAGKRTDVKTTRWAGRAVYGDLLAGGVRMYEYEPTMMHAKTFVVDGRWCTVGTMNFDNRSMVFNDESNLLVFDADVGSALEEMFHADLTCAHEITLARYQKRPWTERLVELGASMVARLL